METTEIEGMMNGNSIVVPLHWQSAYNTLNPKKRRKVVNLLNKANLLSAELDSLSINAPIGQRSKVWQRKQALWYRIDNQIQSILGIL